MSLYEDGGIAKLRDWYTRGADALITETGLASRVGHVLTDDDWTQMGTVRQDEEILILFTKCLFSSGTVLINLFHFLEK